VSQNLHSISDLTIKFNSKFLMNSRLSVLPFYVLHQTIIAIIGYLIIGWNGGILAKYFALGIVSLVIIIGLHIKFIGRMSVFLFPFGMKA
jgi:glucans biosynthesis protein C